MKRMLSIVAAMALALPAALAQGPGSGPGYGQGGGGKGAGKGPGWSFNKDNTRGWGMMSRDERTEHRDRMLSIKTYDECVAYLEEHRKLMDERAKERGRPGPAMPPQNMCERMKQAGRIS